MRPLPLFFEIYTVESGNITNANSAINKSINTAMKSALSHVGTFFRKVPPLKLLDPVTAVTFADWLARIPLIVVGSPNIPEKTAGP